MWLPLKRIAAFRSAAPFVAPDLAFIQTRINFLYSEYSISEFHDVYVHVHVYILFVVQLCANETI